jgi:hypothetical protein
MSSDEPESGVVYLDWIPRVEEGPDRSQRISGVREVEIRDSVGPREFDNVKLVLHGVDGVAVFDRSHIRGFRAQNGVAVPQYEQRSGGE